MLFTENAANSSLPAQEMVAAEPAKSPRVIPEAAGRSQSLPNPIRNSINHACGKFWQGLTVAISLLYSQEIFGAG
jgi:hypothetical protein